MRRTPSVNARRASRRHLVHLTRNVSRRVGFSLDSKLSEAKEHCFFGDGLTEAAGYDAAGGE